MVEDLLPGERDPVVLHEIGEELELLETEFNGFSVYRDAVGGLVKDNAAQLYFVIFIMG